MSGTPSNARADATISPSIPSLPTTSQPDEISSLQQTIAELRRREAALRETVTEQALVIKLQEQELSTLRNRQDKKEDEKLRHERNILQARVHMMTIEV